MTLYSVNLDTLIVEEVSQPEENVPQSKKMFKLTKQSAIHAFLKEVANEHIPSETLKHHCVFVRFNSGKYPEFDIQRNSISESDVHKKFEEGWCLYNGKKRQLEYEPAAAELTAPNNATQDSNFEPDPVGDSSETSEDYNIRRSLSGTDISDNIGEFIEQCGKLGKGRSVSSETLYARYIIWCETNRAVAESQDKFRESMRQRGFNPVNQHIWIGLSLN